MGRRSGVHRPRRRLDPGIGMDESSTTAAGSLSTSDDAVPIDPAKAGWSYCRAAGVRSRTRVEIRRLRLEGVEGALIPLRGRSRSRVRAIDSIFGTGHRSSSPCPTLAICLSTTRSKSPRIPEAASPWRLRWHTERKPARFYPAAGADGGDPGCRPGDPSDQSDPGGVGRRPAAADRRRGPGPGRKLVLLPTSQARRVVRERGPASRRSTTSRFGTARPAPVSGCIAPTPPTARSTRRSRSASGDVFLVPRGYHGPCVAAPGYDMYYLNVMAGPDPERRWMITTDPAYAWLWEEWKTVPPDPRVPLYR